MMCVLLIVCKFVFVSVYSKLVEIMLRF
ncbi:hypothetical protein FWK35_00025408 [Aphis craccivora]|uniref:Uncharacterized protein n=1 Tax=Aphis craccivora TaxID=307492 RepID=A0A6G0Y2V1_APHCR|nr:hypothetical protein FWK35_00025408 [Aphis craccivora]